MNDPRRLKDDPDFIAEAGRALDEEKLVVGNYDLDGLRSRVVGGAPVPATPSWWKVAAVSGATATLVTFALLQLQQPAVVRIEPPSTPELEVLAPAPGVGAPRSSDAAADLGPTPDASEIEEHRLREPTVPLSKDPVPAELPAEPVVDPDADGVARATPPPRPSALVAELADYNRGVELDDAGRWMEAHAAWEAYLATWPDGRLRTEARLGMLRALVSANRPGDVERLASELLATPGLGAHRDDLRLVRAEALVLLERCADAVALLEGSKRNPRVNAVRSTCRKVPTP